jgi:hypothetical protein
MAWDYLLMEKAAARGNRTQAELAYEKVRDFGRAALECPDKRVKVPVVFHRLTKDELDEWNRNKMEVRGPGRYEYISGDEDLRHKFSAETLCATVHLLTRLIGNHARWNPGVFDGIGNIDPDVSALLKYAGVDWDKISRPLPTR